MPIDMDLEVLKLTTEVARLVTMQSWLLIAAMVIGVLGLGFLGWLTHGVSADTKAIAAMTAEVLHRTPERSGETP